MRRVLQRLLLVSCVIAGAVLVRAQTTQQNGQQTAVPPVPAGGQNQQPTATPVFRGGVNFVRVDVIVSDKSGGPVADLLQTDFEVLEDGKPQSIETFKLIRLDGGATPTAEPPRQIRTDSDEESEASRDDVRLFAIFLDEYHVRFSTGASVLEPLTKFIETQLGPSDMLGIMTPLEQLTSIRMTRNHQSVINAINRFRGRKGDYIPMNQFEEQYVYYPTEVVERIRNQVSLSAVKALIVHMGGLKEGRKALILVSEGYSNVVPPQMRNKVAIAPGMGNPNANNPNAGLNDPNQDRYAFFANQDLEFWLQGIYEAASQNNVAIYTVDPRGLRAFEYDIDTPVNIRTDAQFMTSLQNTLRALAIETDGRAIMNRNDIAAGMKQIVRDSSAYYLLGYTSAQAKLDGKFHAITVRVKRPGVQLRARKGYWAMTPESTRLAPGAGTADPVARAAAAPAFEAALAAANQPSRSRVVRTWIGTSRGENGRTRVTFVWEPVSRAAGDRSDDPPSRVALTAVGGDGSPIFRGRVPDPASAPAPLVAASPPSTTARPPSRVTFEVKPGKLQLRMSVEGANAQVLDTETREIAIPDLTAPQVSLGTPQLFRARTARDYQQLKADPDAVPVAAREFSRTERILVRVSAYGPGNSAPALKARMLTRAGQSMNELIITPGAAPGEPAQIDVPLSGLAPAEYMIEITAGTPAADVGAGADPNVAKELIGIRVTA